MNLLARLLTLSAAILFAFGYDAKPQPPPAKAQFVGSQACRSCHREQYDGWKQTRMANVVRDPRLHPEAVLGDFSHSDPIRSFDLSQVDFVYGSRWKQRYFTRRGDDYYVQPAQWDIKHQRWVRITCPPAPIGGSLIIPTAISNVPPALFVTVATR